MKTRSRTITFICLISILLLSSLSACGSPTPTPTPTPEPPGTVSGKVMYKSLTSPGDAEPMGDVLIALCRIAKKGLPEGPPVAKKNQGETEHICTLQGQPTAQTDAQGAFTLDGVPPGAYLVLFHLFPAKTQGTEWHGVALTEAVFDVAKNAENAVAPSGKSDFWQSGGLAISLANYRAGEGFTLSQGNVCSTGFGFCFSIRDERLSPVIELASDEAVEVELTTHFEPGKK